MSSYWSLAVVQYGVNTYKPGQLLSAGQAAPLLAQSGLQSQLFQQGLSPLVDAGGAFCQQRRPLGLADASAQNIMQSAASAAAYAAVGPELQELSLTITYQQLVALGAVTHADFNIGGVLPAGARLAALVSAESWTGFDDATHAVDDITVGTAAGGAQIAASTAVDVTTGTGFPKALGAGGYIGMALGGAQLTARFSATAINLSTLTAGAITLKIFYSIQP
jgi:hypothetical protein